MLSIFFKEKLQRVEEAACVSRIGIKFRGYAIDIFPEMHKL
jgi:hypothetical protein